MDQEVLDKLMMVIKSKNTKEIQGNASMLSNCLEKKYDRKMKPEEAIKYFKFIFREENDIPLGLNIGYALQAIYSQIPYNNNNYSRNNFLQLLYNSSFVDFFEKIHLPSGRCLAEDWENFKKNNTIFSTFQLQPNHSKIQFLGEKRQEPIKQIINNGELVLNEESINGKKDPENQI